MEKDFILLACGSGASSGFMASSMRKAAKKQGLDVKVKAVSDSEIEEYTDMIDVLLIGPHISYLEDELKEVAQEKGFPLIVIPQNIYGTLDGAKAMDLVKEELDQKNRG